MKKYILIAGVNGAGKSTLYQEGKLFDLADNQPNWYKELNV